MRQSRLWSGFNDSICDRDSGPVVQWIGRNFAEVAMQVRFLPGSQIEIQKAQNICAFCISKSYSPSTRSFNFCVVIGPIVPVWVILYFF